MTGCSMASCGVNSLSSWYYLCLSACLHVSMSWSCAYMVCLFTESSCDAGCGSDVESPDAEFYDLVSNPERYTGYAGQSAVNIWKLIYDQNCFKYRFSFRFIRIVARRLKITKFTANRKSIQIEYNRQQDNAIQTYSRLRCSPQFWVAAGPVVLVTSIQRTYHNRTTKQHTILTQYRTGNNLATHEWWATQWWAS